MGLSSSSLIHFTRTKEALKGILLENFKLKYCLESPIIGGDTYKYHVPMVSFCDIPLSQVKNHIESYGCYGIGLRKSWATRMGLNPVLYVQPDSDLSKSLVRASELVASDERDAAEWTETESAIVRDTLNVMRYVKNYEGTLKRAGRSPMPNYRFADEREWRYCPNYHSHHGLLTPSEWKSSVSKDAAHKWLAEQNLEFEPDDIKYIIINDDTEIREFIRHLSDAKDEKYSRATIERLTTRIFTYEQIRDDV